MKTTGRVLVIAFALGLAGQYSSTIATAAAQTAPATATRKGMIKKLDDTTLVLQPADAKNTEATYTLSSETKRTGHLAAGEAVVISYHYERGKVIVTAVTGKSSK